MGGGREREKERVRESKRERESGESLRDAGSNNDLTCSVHRP